LLKNTKLGGKYSTSGVENLCLVRPPWPRGMYNFSAPASATTLLCQGGLAWSIAGGFADKD